MGVRGLWTLLEPAKRPVELDQLTGRTVAIDMNIWLHQAVKSKASAGGPKTYLTVLFRRLCKLLYFGIRPVFVFDGDVPALKKATMAARRRLRRGLSDRATQAQQRVLCRLLKRFAESTVRGSSSTGQKPLTSVKSELLRRLEHQPDVQQAKEDEALFNAPTEPSGEEIDTQGLLPERAGLEYDDLARDYLDGINLYSDSCELDLHSTSFCALPLQAQLRVVQLAREQLDSQDRSAVSQASEEFPCIEKFSTNQVTRLLLRRRLTERYRELSLQLAREEATKQMVSLNNPGFMDTLKARLQSLRSGRTGLPTETFTTALRIQSRDSGHAILIKQSPVKSQLGASEPAVYLERLIMHEESSLKTETPTAECEADVSVPVRKLSFTDSCLTKTDHTEKVSGIGVEIKVESSLCQNPKPVIPSTENVSSPSSVSSPNSTEPEVVTFKTSPIPEHLEVATQLPDVLPTDFAQGKSTSDYQETEHSFPVPIDAVSLPSADKDTAVNSELIVSNPKDSDDEVNESDDEFVDVPEAEVVKDSSLSVSEDDDYSAGSEAEEDDLGADFNAGQLNGTETSFPHQQWVEGDDTTHLDDDVLKEQADRFARQAQTTTARCMEEAQLLLELFGMPYIISPEEAEAQCVALQRSGFVELVASDDSDVWPFGARSVCRYLFAGGSDKFKGRKRSPREPAQYTITDVERGVGLNLANILRFALLCGSDYTPGVQNVGPMTAVEILSEFGEMNDETNSTWTALMEAVDATDLLAAKIVEPLKRFSAWCQTVSNLDTNGDSKSLITSPVRKKWLKLCPPEGFPDSRIVQAYLRPQVTTKLEPLSWKLPNVESLVKYAQIHFGWRPTESTSMLRAVLSRQKQRCIGSPMSSHITDFFQPVRASTLTPSTQSLESPDEVSLPCKRARRAVARLVQKVQEQELSKTTDTTIYTSTELEQPTELSCTRRTQRKRKNTVVSGNKTNNRKSKDVKSP